MSASLLYHAFNIKNVKYKGIEYSGEGIILKAEMSRYIPCPDCAVKELLEFCLFDKCRDVNFCNLQKYIHK